MWRGWRNNLETFLGKKFQKDFDKIKMLLREKQHKCHASTELVHATSRWHVHANNQPTMPTS